MLLGFRADGECASRFYGLEESFFMQNRTERLLSKFGTDWQTSSRFKSVWRLLRFSFFWRSVRTNEEITESSPYLFRDLGLGHF